LGLHYTHYTHKVLINYFILNFVFHHFKKGFISKVTGIYEEGSYGKLFILLENSSFKIKSPKSASQAKNFGLLKKE